MRYFVIILALLLFCLSACSGGNQGKAAGEFLPNVEGYAAHKGSSIGDELEKIGYTAAILAQNPFLATAAYAFSEGVTCLEKQGAIAFNVYNSNIDWKLNGVVAAVNVSRATDAGTVVNCILQQGSSLVAAETNHDPCLDVWLYKEDEVTYVFFYAATDTQVCNEFDKQMPRNS